MVSSWAEQVRLVCSRRVLENEFTHVLNRMLRVSGKSITRVAEISGLDRSYCLRLTRGDRTNPSPESLVRLFTAIVFDEDLIDKDPTVVHGLSELLLASATVVASAKAMER